MRLRGLFACLGVAALSITAVVACRQIVGIEDTPTPPPQTSQGPQAEAGACGLPYAGACASCVTTHCCTQASACAANASCAPFGACLARCNGDEQCRSSCAAANAIPAAASDATSALLACVASSCETDCAFRCGGIAELSAVADAATGCADCVAANGCLAGQTCGSSVACTHVIACILACEGRIVCTNTCVEAEADAGAVASLDSFGSVLHDTCLPQCVGGGNWGCVATATATAPRPQAPATSLTVNFYDYATKATTAGVDVQVCSEFTGTCDPVSATSDATGIALVTVPLPSAQSEGTTLGPTGFIRISSPGDAGVPQIAPALFYWGDPLSQAVGSLSVATLSPGEVTTGLLDVGVVQENGRGIVDTNVDDCSATAAAGVDMEISQKDGKTQRFYNSNGSLSTTATQTDITGVAVFTNVPPGIVDVTARLVSSGAVVSHASILVQPGMITGIYMSPAH